MAEMLQKIIYFGILIILYFALVNGLARRGGGSRSFSVRSSRSSRSISIRSTRVKVHHNVVLSGRIVRGSSIYTSTTWHAAFLAGSIYGGRRYSHYHSHYPNSMPTICTNRFDKRPDGLIYGYFICPKDSDLADEIYCCGPDNREYCCNKTSAEVYYSKHYHARSSGPSIGSIIGAVVSAIVVLALAFYCCKKRKHAGEIIRRLSKRDNRSKHDYHGPQTVPLNSSESTHGDNTIVSQAPPSYADATAVGHDGSQQYPYTCPQPYPSEPYPPGAPQPYPPYNPPDEKTGGQLPEIVNNAPYKPYPNDGPAPYPVMQNGTESLPYPPPNGASYPPPGGAPYPPPGGVPYPPQEGASYPPPGGAPYPPPGGVPYPPQEGAPYPPPSGAPYPPPGSPFSYPAPLETPYPPPPTAPYPVDPNMSVSQPAAQNYALPYPTQQPSNNEAGDRHEKV